MRWTGGLVVALLAMLLAAGSAGAASWSAPEVISAPGEENAEADIAIAPDGTAIAVWMRGECFYTGPDEELHECENARIQYAVRSPGERFSSPLEIPDDPGTHSAAPQVEVDAAGNAIAIWTSVSAGFPRLRYSLRPAGGQFGAAKTVADAVGNSHLIPDLAMAPNGRAAATFVRRVAGVNEIGYAVLPAGGEFGPAESMTGDPGVGAINTAPRIQLDDTGAGIVTWASNSPGGTAVRLANLAPGATEFAPTQTFAPGRGPAFAMAPSGASVIAWIPTGIQDRILYAFRSPGGAFGAPREVLEPAFGQPLAAIDPAGRSIVGWNAFVGSDPFPRSIASPFGGPFGESNPMPPGNEGVMNDLVLSDQGTALALWTDISGPTPTMRASLRPPEGAFGESTVLPGPPQGAELVGAVAAFDARGNAVALWPGLHPGSEEPYEVPLLASVLPIDRTIDPPKPGQRTRPRIDGLSVKPKRFLVGAKPTARASASAPTGTTLRFRLSEPATVQLRVERRKPGVRVNVKGKLRCLPATPRNLERGTGKRCPVFKRAGALVRNNLPSGPNQVGFSGRIGRKALKPGPYRFVISAINRAGNISQPQRTAFQIIDPLQRNG